MRGAHGGRIGYLVLGSPRTGTNLLCHALHATGQAGEPAEWYGTSSLHENLAAQELAHPDSRPEAPRATDWAAYQRALLGRTGSGNRFGVKVFLYHLEPLLKSGQMASPVDLLPDGYRDDVRIITVSRRDVVAQAVSMIIASRTGIFVDVPGVAPRRVPTTTTWWREGPPAALVTNPEELTADLFDSAEVHQLITAIRRHHSTWSDWLADTRFPTLSVTYEDLVDRRESVLSSTFELLGIHTRAAEFTDPGPRRQATALNDELAARYRLWLADRPGAATTTGRQL
ncbi:Stf0 family sulfotransferase [Nocardiopsis tropica]|uniref:Trehalose 2-sulfotransferase n=1 Tax=Nocardiopsis tropica TaxID=109330 RepID=A0ABV1ZSM9_9ACTN